MKLLHKSAIGLLASGWLLLSVAASAGPAPEFTHGSAAEWLNSVPLSLGQLRGKVVLVEFWAFDCINCLRSIPWVEGLESRLSGRGLVVVGVHTPELAEERPAANVGAAVRRLGIRHPVMLDANSSYWRALGNQYWPAFYLIGRDGSLVAQEIGEMHAGDPAARRLEAAIKAQL